MEAKCECSSGYISNPAGNSCDQGTHFSLISSKLLLIILILSFYATELVGGVCIENSQCKVTDATCEGATGSKVCTCAANAVSSEDKKKCLPSM